jgi:hypothetical protein
MRGCSCAFQSVTLLMRPQRLCQRFQILGSHAQNFLLRKFDVLAPSRNRHNSLHLKLLVQCIESGLHIRAGLILLRMLRAHPRFAFPRLSRLTRQLLGGKIAHERLCDIPQLCRLRKEHANPRRLLFVLRQMRAIALFPAVNGVEECFHRQVGEFLRQQLLAIRVDWFAQQHRQFPQFHDYQGQVCARLLLLSL